MRKQAASFVISKDISLRGLEVFASIARTGSVARTAEELALSLPAVSQQLKNLEDSLGRPLLDHARRPMQLTEAGRVFRRRTEEMLRQLRQGLAEVEVLDLAHLTRLRLGVIDDFDTHLTPDLTAMLAGALAGCDFRLHTRPSHELVAMAAAGRLDVVVAAAPAGGIETLTEFPLLADPFVMIVPKGLALDPAAPLTSLRGMPFLRYGNAQMIAQDIEAQLRRHRLHLPDRFELDSNPAIHALVANGSGWALTTALSTLRSARFHERIDAHPVPFGAFARTIVLLSPADWIPGAAADLAHGVRGLLRAGVVAAAQERFPWLTGQMRVLEG